MKSILSGSCNGLLAQPLHILLPCLQIIEELFQNSDDEQ